MSKLTFGFFVLTAALCAQTAPDATAGIPDVPIISSEYKLAAGFDDIVLADAPAERRLPTELWARVYRRAPLSALSPLLVFLHGNHATCGRFAGAGPGRFDVSILYTFTGTCPPGYVVVPSHEGYAYLAEPLAKLGYIVVSINANRGVNAAPGYVADRGLNLRRGRLVLRHLEQLYKWHSGTETPPGGLADLVGKIDFAHAGLMGHSRGGEGVRAAYHFYGEATQPAGFPPNWQSRIPGLSIQGIFEIGPVDGQTSLTLNAINTIWNVLLPMCDGDVFNLQGVRPFDRMLLLGETTPTQKSTYTVWGTNHNFYNTEWQISDSAGCLGHKRLFPQLLGSPEQRTVSRASVLALFRGAVGAAPDPTFLQNFNPEFSLPSVVTAVTRVDRGYTDSPSSTKTKSFDDFPSPLTNTYSTSGNVTFTFGLVPNHTRTAPPVITLQRAALVNWNGPGSNTWFQSNAPSAMDVSAYKTLDFRVSRQCGDLPCTRTDEFFNFTSNFSIRVVDDLGGVSSAVQLKDHLVLTGPVGGLVRFVGTSPHPILQTVRIPLSAFSGADLTKLRGVRFVFDDTRRDEIYIANIRLSNVSGVTSLAIASDLAASEDSPLDPGVTNSNDQNSIKATRSVSASLGQAVEIELTSNREFLPHGELLVLRIGEQEFNASRYPASGETNTVVFTLSAAEFGQLKQGDSVVVQYGSGSGLAAWNFGHLDKNLLR